MKTTCTMPSANGVGAVKIEKILDEELADKCALYARVTIPAGSDHMDSPNHIDGMVNP